MSCGQIAWQPGQKQIKTVIVCGKPQHESPHLALPQQIGERRSLSGFRAIFGLRSATSDVLALGAGEKSVFARVAIESVEQREKENTDQAGNRKIPAPSKMQ